MKNSFYQLLIGCLFFSSCASKKIPFKSVPNEVAKQMYSYYLNESSGADHSFKAVPKLLALDKKTLKTFRKADEVKFILAAYLPGTTPAPLNKNTILLQLTNIKDGVKSFSYFDLRQQMDPRRMVAVDKEDVVCPLPPDCAPEIEN